MANQKKALKKYVNGKQKDHPPELVHPNRGAIRKQPSEEFKKASKRNN